MIVLWTEGADTRFRKALNYIRQRNPRAASDIAAAVIDKVNRLTTTPRMGRPGRWPNTRELIIARYQYIVVYRIRHETVEILTVRHTRERFPENAGGIENQHRRP